MNTTERIIGAILNEGRNPSYHSKQLQRLREEWPTLTSALVEMLKDNGKPIPREWLYKF